MTRTVTITVGRNIGTEPMHDCEWDELRTDLRALLARLGATVHVDCAAGRGTWDGIEEENVTTVAGLDAGALDALATGVATLRDRFRQDAVAMTIGETVLI